MTTSSTTDSSTTRRDPETASGSEPGTESDPTAQSDDDSPSVADRLQTAARVVWASFLALVVVFTLIPPVAVWLGAVPFDPPPTTPYFAFVGLAVVGTAALIAAAIYDV